MKKFLKNPWTISMGSVFFGFLLTVLYDLIKGKNIFSTVGGILSNVITFLLSVMNFRLKVWWVLIGLIVVFLILCLIARYNESKTIQAEQEKPPFFKYTKDQIKGWNWEWRWYKNLYGQYDIEDLHPVCSSCGTPLVRSDNIEYNLECMRCNKKYSEYLPDMDNIKIYIRDSAKRGIYQGNESEINRRQL